MDYRFLVLSVVVLLWSSSATAQLISPGELTSGHASIDNISNCTSCHTLGVRGIVSQKCLDCHKPLETRILANEGYHATVSTQNCADCHKEHFGRTFDPIRFDTSRFDHTATGFTLLASHTTIGCRDCHVPSNINDQEVVAFKSQIPGKLEKTFLGLGETCINCHESASPHEAQFRQTDCGSCHNPTTWTEAPEFDHAATSFPLVGQHRQVNCASCHGNESNEAGEQFIRYKPLTASECSSCHNDPHENSFGPQCSTCHSPSGFDQLNVSAFERTFNHNATGFTLVGGHRRISCSSCHAPAESNSKIAIGFEPSTLSKSYPSPIADECMSCHVDIHESRFENFAGGSTCNNCHSQDGWSSVNFDIDRHNEQTSFQLLGSHRALPCTLCHSGNSDSAAEPVFDFPETGCTGCHTDDNVHGDQFSLSSTCSDCHSPNVWSDVSAFNHSSTSFPLKGRHEAISCDSCHNSGTSQGSPVIIFNDLSMKCANCHVDDNPHQGQFEGVNCENCHSSNSFTVTSFDHDNTAFPLSPAHQKVVCGSCHIEEETASGVHFVRFKPVTTRCADCH